MPSTVLWWFLVTLITLLVFEEFEVVHRSYVRLDNLNR